MLQAAQKEILKDIKIIELASVLAGPAVGMFFAELGAKVIKVENELTHGDVTRSWKLPTENKDDEFSAYYCSVNWGKETRLLNLRDPKARQLIYEEIKTADIVISNFKPSSAKKMGFDYDQLKTLNDQLIFAQLFAFDAESTRPAYDIVLQAEAGFLYMTGEPDREPVRMPVALIDLLAAHQLKQGILLALYQRTKTNKGAYIETSLLKSAIASLANQATNWLVAGHLPQRMGSLHPNIAPYGDIFYDHENKPFVLAVGADAQFEKLCICMKIPDLAKDHRFATNADRVIHREALYQTLAKAFIKFDRKDLLRFFEIQGIPAGQIKNMKEVFESDTAQSMLLDWKTEQLKSVASVAFELKQ